MRKLLLVALLGGAAWFAYGRVMDWRAVSAYEKFASAWTRGDKEQASRFGEPAAAEMCDRQSLRGMRSGAVMEAFRGESYRVESRTRLPNGDLRLEVKQTIRFDPPGASTAIGGAMWTTIHHSATLHRTSGGWRVSAFNAKFLDMGETRRR